MSANPTTLAPYEVRAGFRQLAEERRSARGQYLDHARQEAEAEHEYRKTVAREFTRQRADGQPVGAAEIIARGEAADAQLERDLAHSKAKAALLRIEELEADRANLRHLSEREEREA